LGERNRVERKERERERTGRKKREREKKEL
jgi:hypothetical protein